TMHAVIRASVPLMELAAERCRAPAAGAGGEEPGLRALARFLPEHIGRELHHDDWLLRDMAAAGLDPERERERPPAPSVARMVGAQYYWVRHHHPVSLLGYIAVLELHAPSVELPALLAERTGLPPAAFDTLRLHAEEDGGHSAEVLAAIDAAACSASARRAVRLSVLHTAAALGEVLDEISAPDSPEAPRRESARTRPGPSGPAEDGGVAGP
uniref:iron-containing redox enzyme family protein n=2 Tax=unclassified Streptomyces TaxID=2593676 RepID=UPI000CD49FB9